MSDELNLTSESVNPSSDATAEDEYEEISSDEVDRVVDALEELSETVESENIQAFLDEASNNILSLVYEEDDLDEIQDEAA
jgi:hypothetical protein